MQEHRMDVVNLPVTIMRGGTSKGIYRKGSSSRSGNMGAITASHDGKPG